MEDTIALPEWLVSLSVVFGGMTGAMHGARKKYDLFGTLLVAIAAALGAGVIRDLTLGRVPVMLYTNLAGYAVLGALAGYLLARMMRYINRTIYALDTMLIGVWVVLGAELALQFGLSKPAAIMMGVITSVGGGVVRDVLCRDAPTAFNPAQFEAAGAVVASFLFVTVDSILPDRGVAEAIALISASLLRIVALRYRWHSLSAVALSERLRGRRSIYDPTTGTIETIIVDK